MKVRCQAGSDIGRKREVNQDSYKIGDDPSRSARKGYLMVVCDGMGGHEAGEVASRIGADTIFDEFYHSEDEDCRAALEHAFHEANRRIHEQVQGYGNMGTTGVAALLFKNHLYIANVGDSRAYLIRNGEIRPISRDHSLVAEQVAAGILTPEQARHSHYRNMITRALGYRPEVQVDFPFTSPVQPGNIVVLSSDGLHGLVEDDEIAQIVTRYSPDALDEAVRQLIDTANDRGGTDNITVAMAVVDELDRDISRAPSGKAAQGSEPASGPSLEEADQDAPTSRIPVPIAAARSSQTIPLEEYQRDAPTVRSTAPASSAASTRPLTAAEAENDGEHAGDTRTGGANLDHFPPRSPPPWLIATGGLVIALTFIIIVGFVVLRPTNKGIQTATAIPTTVKPSFTSNPSDEPTTPTTTVSEELLSLTATTPATATQETRETEETPTLMPSSQVSSPSLPPQQPDSP
ncbi:MAG: Stp1/IreP family PP2C-type Ser/Thr phosphatase [Chloroflexaceae bacterium]|nr:Stp1/IreP family PP2C-type Ser/Thr phosphatase [Chloroflexaceae bacterium]